MEGSRTQSGEQLKKAQDSLYKFPLYLCGKVSPVSNHFIVKRLLVWALETSVLVNGESLNFLNHSSFRFDLG